MREHDWSEFIEWARRSPRFVNIHIDEQAATVARIEITEEKINDAPTYR